ncbi:diaminopimelate dehydrogenase [Aliarcobacter thereius]|uniref:Meso-diaminopimelate D-dehydrogenase n=1 Tax=Aliarcobacter thereius LMG 24486 TaxID=1032240 RepID=A0A1C7WQV0_9BACT|nr:diaminopimelate dehydrogenase [Aliarcobacter thereius]OCL95938.1 Meso-diaminopimelate D-dehydrogenase [Aliarcobacter thereius LMG 24486]QBF16090.1 meso-diaminopimelate D-dehydrogenase [Aliarcobacter thereius LMG 24486]TLS94571.1 diaminopimelate dehydrogenase [Aliarcobacter thereius]
MSNKIKVAILGYGNLGKGVELSILKNPDMSLEAVFSRRDPKSVKTINTPVYSVENILDFKDKIDVLILCGGSKDDLPVQTPEFAQYFNTVDSYDNHAQIPEYFASVDAVAQKSKKIAMISVGWDPGMFSINRLFGEALLPDGETYTFWGKGLSQGHSDAIRRVEGVKAGVQYTLPSTKAIEEVRSGVRPSLSTKDKHTRECFIVLKDGADASKIENEIKTMPNYFEPYDTSVNFISQEEFDKNHNTMPHGGFVIRSGNSSENINQVIEYSLKLDSNPEFTASVIVAYTRAVYKMALKGEFGAKSVLDVAPALLSIKSNETLRKELL